MSDPWRVGLLDGPTSKCSSFRERQRSLDSRYPSLDPRQCVQPAPRGLINDFDLVVESYSIDDSSNVVASWQSTAQNIHIQ
jgi:hypothetical protein